MSPRYVKRPRILIVDDSPADARLLEEALREGQTPAEIVVARNGMEALSLLRPEDDRPPLAPSLILLDLNMPRMDGRELLARIKGDEALRSTPVLMLTTSRSVEDVEACYDLRANGYFSKPLTYDAFLDLAQTLREHWLERATLPA